jgi:hypothetical protein
MNRAYWVGMALCGEGLEFNHCVYFENPGDYPIRVTLYCEHKGDLWGYAEFVPFVGY